MDNQENNLENIKQKFTELTQANEKIIEQIHCIMNDIRGIIEQASKQATQYHTIIHNLVHN